MTPRTHRLASAGLALAGWLAATPLLAWAPTATAERTLRAGQAWAEVLPDTDGAALIRAAVDIKAPPSTVWAVMTDCRLAQRFIADLASCTVLSGDQRQGWDVRDQFSRGNIFLPDLHNVVRSEYQPYSLIRFRKAGGDLKAEDGEWRLEAIQGGAGTRVIYINRVKANILVPAVIVRAGLRGSTPKVLMNLQRESVAAVGRVG
jgi:uncharacterized protein YndB with AHSA1/START domain